MPANHCVDGYTGVAHANNRCIHKEPETGRTEYEVAFRSTVMGLAYQIWHITHIVPTLARLPTHSDTLPILSMHAINRFLYGPTPEERVRAWQGKLRQESRVLDREMRQVWLLAVARELRLLTRAFSWISRRIKCAKRLSNFQRKVISNRRGFWRVRS